MKDYNIRAMDEADRLAIVDIFNYYIFNTWAAYSEEPVDFLWAERFRLESCGYPVYTMESTGGEIVGFGRLKPFRPGAKSFGRTAECAYFILQEHTGRGLGTSLLERMKQDAVQLGIDCLIVHICSMNEASLAFHREKGFQECGRLRRVGRKFGKDFDMVYMQMFLGPERDSATERQSDEPFQ
jgi:phosphinothricin acetyltransferase